TTTETIIKYQLSTGVTTISVPIDSVTSVEIPDKTASAPVINTLAVTPAPTPAKPAAKPANGCLFILEKTIAAKGGIITNAASEARLPNMSVTTTAYVANELGALIIVLLIAVSSKPTLSANPIPNIIAKTIASGLHVINLSNIEVTINSKPDLEIKLFITRTSSSPGCVNETSNKDINQDKIITPIAR